MIEGSSIKDEDSGYDAEIEFWTLREKAVSINNAI